MKRVLLALLVLASSQLSAQVRTTLSGVVTDEKNSALSYVTIALHTLKDSAVARTALSGDDGTFRIPDVPAGTYFLRAFTVGYARYSGQKFVTGSTQSVVDLGRIVLAQDAITLSDVTVTASRPFIEQKPDKLIINIENSMLATGSSTLELLGKLPGLAVDPNGNVSLNNRGVTVFINNRPSYLSGPDLAAFLTGLSAEQIQKIELVKNPSARYDAAGGGGIVNIILKKDLKLGLNGNANTSYSQGLYSRYNLGTSMNYRNEKVNLYGSLNYGHVTDISYFDSFRRFGQGTPTASRFTQNGEVPKTTRSGGIRIGADYTLSKKSVLGILLNGTANDAVAKSVNTTNITGNTGTLDSIITSNSRNTSNWKSYLANINFKHSFDSTGREISFDADYVDYQRENGTFYDNRYLSGNGSLKRDPDTLLNDYPGTLLIRSVKTDYVHPFGKGLKLETGMKASWVKNDNNLQFTDVVNGQEILNRGLSNNFIYNENIYAAYINAMKEFKKFSIQLGLRAEQTRTRSQQVTTGQLIKRGYFQVFPSLFLGYDMTDKHRLGLNITRRINRPSYQRLNPYRRIYDPLNYEEGNPYLQPSFSNDLDLNYSFNNQLFVSLSYSYENKSATNVILQNETTRTTITTFGNLAKAQGGGLTLTYSSQVTPWLRSNNFLGFFFNRFEGPYLSGYLDIFQPTFNLNSFNTFTVSKTLTAELGINYLSSQQQGLLKIDDIGWQINPGIQKIVFDKRGTVRLSVIDLFDARTWDYSTRFENIDTRYESSWDNRRLTLALSWKFGKQTVAQERRRRTGSEDEKSRVEQ